MTNEKQTGSLPGQTSLLYVEIKKDGNKEGEKVFMKKKVIGVLLTGMLVFSMTACGGNTENKEATGEESQEIEETVVAVVEDGEEGEVEVSQEVQDALKQAIEEDKMFFGVVKTVYGNFNGFYDDDSVEILVDGDPVEYTLGNDEVKTEVGNYQEGDEIVFEAQTDSKVITEIVIVGAVTEAPEVVLTEEEAGSGIVVGSLLRYESENRVLVQVGEEEVVYALSEAAQKDIYDVKVNFGYDLKFQTEGSGDSLTISNFIYE